MEIQSGVYTYDLEWEYNEYTEPLSVTIIETDAGTVLFGGGDSYTAEELVGIAEDHGVDAIVIEHGDVDHYDAVPALREAIDPEVAAPAGDMRKLNAAGIAVDVELTAGEPYRDVLPIATPGHTPDNMAYLYDSVLVAGDTVVGSDSVFAAAGPWSGPLAVITPDFSHDDAQARDSVANLLDYEFDTVLVTHGSNVLSDGYDAVETLVADLDGTDG
ncbi:MAG: MBL fold metallo-hydrolase [Halobacteriales archaeon]